MLRWMSNLFPWGARQDEREPSKKAMKNAARDPAGLKEVSRRIKAKREIRAPQDATDKQIEFLVDRLLDHEDKDLLYPQRQLEQIGKRAEPALLRAIADPRYQQPFEKQHFAEDTPFEKVSELLAEIGSNTLIPHLLPLVGHVDEDERKHAAISIATVGSDDAIEPTLTALADKDEYVQSYAIMGIEQSIRCGHASRAFLDHMFDALIPLAAGEPEKSDGDAAKCLLKIDRERGAAVLTSDRCLRFGNPNLLDCLRAISNARITVDHSLLWPIYDAATEIQKDYPARWIQGEILAICSRDPDDRVQKEAEKAIDSDDEWLRQYAQDAICTLLGIAELGNVVTVEGALGWKALPHELKVVYLVWVFDAEVKNGGFSQFFFNSAGDRWPETIKACEEIGATKTADMLRRAVAVFGPKGPSTNRTRRMKQYGNLSDEQEQPLDDLSSEFYKNEDRREALLTRHVIKHQDVFREYMSPEHFSDTDDG